MGSHQLGCPKQICAICPLVQTLISRMGWAQSTLLGLVLNHFKDFCQVTEDSSLVVCPLKLTIFCRNEWPTYKVRWPEEEVLISPSFTGWRLWFWSPGPPGPSSLYITTWQYLVKKPAAWMRPFLSLISLLPALLPQQESRATTRVSLSYQSLNVCVTQ